MTITEGTRIRVDGVRNEPLRGDRLAVFHEVTGHAPWTVPLLTRYAAFDPQGFFDSTTVAALCSRYAKARPALFTEAQRRTLVVAATVHDVGKTEIKHEDVTSVHVYSAEERLAKLSGHVEAGYTMTVTHDKQVALIIAGHHLKQDDRGSYPSATEVWVQTDDPFIELARDVVRVADRVDALRTARSYKPEWTVEQTRESLLAQGFENEMVDFMLQAYDQLNGEALA